jgi:hypothetical protein
VISKFAEVDLENNSTATEAPAIIASSPELPPQLEIEQFQESEFELPETAFAFKESVPNRNSIFKLNFPPKKNPPYLIIPLLTSSRKQLRTMLRQPLKKL